MSQTRTPVRVRRRMRRRRRRRSPLLGWGALCLLGAVMVLLVARRGRAGPVEPLPEPLPEWMEQGLLPVNEWSRPGTAMDGVNGIVIHYVGNPGTTAEQNRSYFAGLAQSRTDYASSHFLVGLEGEILLCVPPGEVAYCSSSRNHDTISIEVCHPDDTGEFTLESYRALVKLVNWLRQVYGLEPEDVIRHYDVTGKECPRYYVEHPEAWERFREDLGQGEKENR